jgi:hypothetical protein
LLYSHDPRKDLPDELRERVAKTLPGGAEVIVYGWMAK